jgi:HEAT repeat protein
VEDSADAEQARLLLASLPTRSNPRSVLERIHRLGRAGIGPLIEALADPRVERFAVTALVELGPLAQEPLLRARTSPDIHVRIRAGEALARAGLDDEQ